MPTTMSTLMCRDFLGTHVQPGRSRHSPAKRDRNWGSKCFRGSLVCDNKRQSEMRGKVRLSQIYLHSLLLTEPF